MAWSVPTNFFAVNLQLQGASPGIGAERSDLQALILFVWQSFG